MSKHRTHNDIPSNTRATVVGIVNARVADSIDLALLNQAGALEYSRAKLHRRA